jgi:hypothetical protein
MQASVLQYWTFAAAAHGTLGAAHLAYVVEGLLMPVSSVASRNSPK